MTRRKPSAAPVAGALAELLAAATDPACDLVEASELAGVVAQRGDLALERRADVDQLVRLVRAPQVELGDLPRPEALVEVLAEVERVACGREDGVDGRLADGAMIGMVDPLVVDEEDGRVVGHDDLGPERPDGARDALAQAQRRLDLAVGLVEEVDALDPDLGGRRALLALAQDHESVDIGRGVVAALVAARDEQVADAAPSLTQRATVPAAPNSMSSGWAATTRTRSGVGSLSSGIGLRRS